jgi:hypothetical protein
MVELNSRERRALKAFEQREVLYVFRLPAAIGRKTMVQLAKKGLVETADPAVGKYSNDYRWRLVREASDKEP